MISFSDSNWDKEVLQASMPVLVHFAAAWSGPSGMLNPVIDTIQTENRGKLLVGKLDVDENQTTPAKYGVQSTPSLLLFHRGELVASRVGFVNAEQVRAMISSAPPPSLTGKAAPKKIPVTGSKPAPAAVVETTPVPGPNTLVLYYFRAAWSAPCLMMDPLVDQFTTEKRALMVVKVDADIDVTTCNRYGVRNVPAFVVANKGTVKGQANGTLTLDALRKFVQGVGV